MNLIDLLRKTQVEDLDLPESMLIKLRAEKVTDVQKLYASVQTFRAFGKSSLATFTAEEMKVLSKKFTELFIANGLMKPPSPTAQRKSVTVSPSQTNPSRNTRTARPPVSASTFQAEKKTNLTDFPPEPSASPLSIWENRLMPQLRRVELIGEIQISKEDLDDISLHFKRFFSNHDEQKALKAIGMYYPATFLVFMVGHGIFDYDCGDFWPAIQRMMPKSIDQQSFGKQFEKLIRILNKPVFRDLQEKGRRYVDPILAHGGIPVYCLNDFFSNIVLNCVIRPQLSALEGEELIDEILKHPSYTYATDKPVINFLKYGGATAANLLDRARKMLIAWQQNQVFMSADEVGLPAHITQYFTIQWAPEHAALAAIRSVRNRLKRPQLSLDPWGLGIFLKLPSQPVSALNTSAYLWKVEAGEYVEELKARTQWKGDQLETREVLLRLNQVSENIQVNFTKGESGGEWKITVYSPDHPILAFDPVSGQYQNHILARETWLLYPRHLSLSIQAGEGNLVEILPDLPGDWSKFKLECWDLSRVIRLGLLKNEQLGQEIYVRNQERVEIPSLEGGEIVPTDLDENPIPVYSGIPPRLRIPLGRSDDLQAELSRWQIQLENKDIADPEISIRTTIADLPEGAYTFADGIVYVGLAAPNLLTGKYTVK